VWTADLNEVASGALAASLTSSATTATVTNGGLVGVGSLLRADSERMLVTDKIAVNTSTTISANLASNVGATTVSVSDGSGFSAGEEILIDAERMFVTDVSGNNLVVKRQRSGTTLSSHTSGAAVWAYRRLTVERGVLGTTAAAHDSAAALLRHEAPSLVQELTMAYTLRSLEQGSTSYNATAGSGDNQRESSFRGVTAIERDCLAAYGRQARTRGI
jgi:hypothetical protein